VMELFRLKDAGLAPPAIQYLNAHATSTQLGIGPRQRQSAMLWRPRGESAVSSTKSMTVICWERRKS